MESERATRDSAGLAVESLSPAIGEARANVGQDAFGAVANGTSDALEGFEPRTPCPADPLVELDAREPFAPAVEDPDEGVLEQVGTIEPLVLALQLGEPERVEQRQVPEALQELPTSPLELLALLFGGRSTDLVATNLVDGILREALHMKSVEDDLRLRRRFGDRLDVRRGHVDGDVSLQHRCVKKRAGLDTLDGAGPASDDDAGALTRRSRSARRGTHACRARRGHSHEAH